MSVRRLIAEADVSTLNVSRFCREHGIGRDAFYEWRRRFDEDGEAGLESRSRAPNRVANRTPDDIESLIVEVRKDLAGDGLDAGPATIHYWLERRLASARVPSPSTIWRVLSRRGFITADPSKSPGRRWRSFVAERANECWQSDMTHWPLADGVEVEIINVLDDCSRLAVSAYVVERATLASTWDAIADGAARYGWPERALTDNGSIFGPTFGQNLAALGIRLGHSRPYHPQTCGKVERFHQTQKKWLAAHDPAQRPRRQATRPTHRRAPQPRLRRRRLGRPLPDHHRRRAQRPRRNRDHHRSPRTRLRQRAPRPHPHHRPHPSQPTTPPPARPAHPIVSAMPRDTRRQCPATSHPGLSRSTHAGTSRKGGAGADP